MLLWPGDFGQLGGLEAVTGLQRSDRNSARHLHLRIGAVERPDPESSPMVHPVLRGGGQRGAPQPLHPVVLVPDQPEREVPALSAGRWLFNDNNVHLSCAHQRPERSHDTY